MIEDEPMVREVLQVTLERNGFRVLMAGGGDEALDLCESAAEPIDLVLTDLVMSGVSGTDLVGYLAIRYSSSQVDHRKVGKLALAIQVAFQELGVFSASGTAVPLQPDGTIPPTTIQMLENAQQTSSIGRLVSPAIGSLGGTAENGAVAALQKELERALAPEIFRKEIALRQEPDGLVISLREVGFFPSGSAVPDRFHAQRAVRAHAGQDDPHGMAAVDACHRLHQNVDGRRMERAFRGFAQLGSEICSSAAAGGWTIGQDAESCAVYGMPRSAAELNALSRVAPLSSIANEIMAALAALAHAAATGTSARRTR